MDGEYRLPEKFNILLEFFLNGGLDNIYLHFAVLFEFIKPFQKIV